MEIIKTYENSEDGLASIVATGNERHAYRAIHRDTDANETVSVGFVFTLDDAENRAKSFTYGIAIENL